MRALEGLLGSPVDVPRRTRPSTDAVATTTRTCRAAGSRSAENTRFYPGRGAERPGAGRARSRALGDFYVNDAFGSAHRAHASTEAVARLLKPAVSGFLMEKELKYLGQALDRPEAAVRGGPGRRQDLRQDRPDRGAAAQGGRDPHRRRHGLHLLQGDGARDRELPGGGRSGRDGARRCSRTAGGKLVLPGRRGDRPRSSTARRRPGRSPRDAIPAGWAMFDIDPASERGVRRAHHRGRHRGLERADGRLRDAAVRPRHAGGRRRDGARHRRRGRSRWSAAATRPPRWPPRGWPTG